MWADRSIAQLICRPETLNHSRLQAACRLGTTRRCLWENGVLESSHSGVLLTPLGCQPGWLGC